MNTKTTVMFSIVAIAAVLGPVCSWSLSNNASSIRLGWRRAGAAAVVDVVAAGGLGRRAGAAVGAAVGK